MRIGFGNGRKRVVGIVRVWLGWWFVVVVVVRRRRRRREDGV